MIGNIVVSYSQCSHGFISAVPNDTVYLHRVLAVMGRWLEDGPQQMGF